MDTLTNPPTDEQAHILSLARSTDANLMIDALAGCGKTTTLEMIERAVPTKPILYLVFAAKNAKEAEKRMLSTTTVRTFNSLGHRVWAKSCAKNLSLDPKKCNQILVDLIKASPKSAQGPMWDSLWSVIHGVGLAKSLGYVPDGKFPNAKRLISQGDFHASLEERPDDLVADLIDVVLTKSIQTAYEGFIDYNDQIYMPALFGGTFPRFPLVKVDEYQDLNPANHAMLERLVKHRLIGVGDPWQNIYGFRGAKSNGMSEAKARYAMTACDLSTSFRCPSAIVENARWRVPHFKWIKEGGHVEHLKALVGGSIPDNAAIICRNNAPLFKLALNLLAAQRSVSIAGSEIGPKVVGIMKKLGDDSTTQAQLLGAINDWEQERLSKESTTASDLAECMRVFASFGTTLAHAISYAEHLFAQKGTIRLLTGHKSKGLEFDTVYHLDPWLLKEDEQDLNLRYVIQTRSRDQYFEIDSRSIRW